MKNIMFSRLHDIGIEPLTGEACAYSMRVLCDLSEKGTGLIREYFGLATGPVFQANWNSRVGDSPAVASIMLHRDAFPALVRFALFREGFQYVYGPPDEVRYTAFSDSDIAEYPGLADIIDGKMNIGAGSLLHRNPRGAGPAVDSRNVHAFTGRVV